MDTSPSSKKVQLHRLDGEGRERIEDAVAREEPLEIRIEGRSVAVLMRTPGHDEELATGFLVSEGVVRQPKDLLEVSVCPESVDAGGNVVDVLLGRAIEDWQSLERSVFASSSCGLCGKTRIDDVFQQFPPIAGSGAPPFPAGLIRSLPDQLRAAQSTFDQTGGLHACAVFDRAGTLLVSREDVGRHNALDKILGWALKRNLLPLQDHLLLLSGRVSLEMIQKALAAGIPLVAAISAPSSLAVEFADQAGQTLIGFLRGSRMNLYTHPHRVGD